MAARLRYLDSQRIVLSGVIVCILMIFNCPSLAQKNPDRFISIDCGSNAQFADDMTDLLWIGDEEYSTPGSNGVIQNMTLVDPGSYNYQALQTFRYFSENPMKSKYCYEITLAADNISFLIRATFLHGNSSELPLPIQFDVFVGASLWEEMTFSDGDDLYEPRVLESIFFSPPEGNIIYICLVPRRGVPFMSSLELRELDPAGLMYTYSFGDISELFFTNIFRFNIGGEPLRFPSDAYDRLWSVSDYDVESIKIPKTWSEIGPDVNNVPSEVMESAWISDEGAVLRFDVPGIEPGSFAYGIFYFASNTSGPFLQQITLDHSDFFPFNVTSQPSQESYFHVLNGNRTSLVLDGAFTLNGMEFYQAKSILQQTTNANHIYVVNFMKETLNLTSWYGDPCTPVPHDWIGCYLEYKGYSWLIDNLTISHVNNVSGLTTLDSKWWIGENGQTVNYMSITNSNVDSELFESLLQDFIEPSWLQSLNMSFNNISVFPNSQWWSNSVVNNSDNSSQKKVLASLDLSHNKLTQMPCFKDIPFFSQIRMLNLSNNMISGPFPDTSCFSNLSSLEVLVLSNNFLQGEIPSSLMPQNLPSLQKLDIANNSFSGNFPSDSYFTDGNSTFKSLNADNNEFSGSLDLSTWYDSLQLEAMSSNVSKVHDLATAATNNETYDQFFSFLNNNIRQIEPSIKLFQILIDTLIHREDFNQSGILLGGNPFCGSGGDFTKRYMCRSSKTEKVNADVSRQTKKVILLSSILGGGFVFLCFLFFTFVIWKLSKKVYRLKLVERELANRSVQPPYYSYADLKAATQNFHKDNHLGKGSFGEVYKGILSNGTTIAVKRLFNSNKKQVLNEFLNEVVLITGIKHKNLIQLKGCCIENEERILVYGFAEHGNVEDALWDKAGTKKLSWKKRYDICIGVANGLTYLHEELQPKIIHRDIKPANILLDKNYSPKIGDFGLAKEFLEDVDEHVTQVICGTTGYFAPEYFDQGRLTTKVDVFSFGVVALEIVSGRRSFNPRLPPHETQLIPWARNLQRSGSTLQLVDPALKQYEYSDSEVVKLINIALMCVETDPELRPAMSVVEAMLLEAEDRLYDNLCSAFSRRGENNYSMERVLKSLLEGRNSVAISSPSVSSLGSSTSKTSSRSSTLKTSSSGSSTLKPSSSKRSTLSPVSEVFPLLELREL